LLLTNCEATILVVLLEQKELPFRRKLLQFWQGIQNSRCIVWRQAHKGGAEAHVRLGIELDVFVAADDLEAKLPNSQSNEWQQGLG